MSKMNSLRVGALFLILATPALSAKTSPPVQDPLRLNLSIERRLVRFATNGGAVDWRLEVSDQQGQEVFDTQFATGTTLDWPLVNGQGQDVESGVYSYTLSIRTPGNDNVRSRKGLLLVQRGNNGYDVRAVSDQQAALAADGETAVTVTGGADAATGGTTASGTPTQTGSAGALPTNLGTVSFMTGQGFISGSGTTGKVTKWLDGPGGVVGDTHISETNGTVVVGDGSFTGNVTIFGAANADVFAGMGVDVVSGPAFNYGYSGNSFGRSSGFFNVRPDASAVAPNPSLRFATANVQRMIITNAGNVGIGTTSPQLGRLQVVNADGVQGQIQVGATTIGGARKIISFGDNLCAAECVYIGEEDSDDSLAIFSNGVINFKGGSNVRPFVDNSANLGDATHRWGTVFAVNGAINTSDARMKQGIENLSYGLGTILKLRPVSFEWKVKSDGRKHLGLLAQEVDTVVPEAVYHDKDPEAPLGMSYNDLIPVVIKAIQEQQGVVEQKAAEIDKLKAENASLQERLAIVEGLLQQLLKDAPVKGDIKKQQ